MTVLSTDLSGPELPHLHVIPINIARWIRYFESRDHKPIITDLEHFSNTYSAVSKLNIPERYLLLCYTYGRSVDRNDPGNIDSERRSVHSETLGVVEIIRSPVTPESLHSTASAWSFTPTRGATSRFSDNEETDISLDPYPRSKSENDFVSSSTQRLFRNNASMGLPVARSVDAYNQYSRDDESVDFLTNDDDLSPVDYTTRRQTSVRTAGLGRQTIDDDDDELMPVEYDTRRHTEVASAVLRHTDSPVITSKRNREAGEFVDFDEVHVTHKKSIDNDFRKRTQTEARSAEIHRIAPESEKNVRRDVMSTHDVVNYENVQIIHEHGEESSVRPRLQTEVHAARIQRLPNVPGENGGAVDESYVLPADNADVKLTKHRPRALSEGAKTKKRKSKREKKEEKEEDDYRTTITRRRTVSTGKKKSKKEKVVSSISKY